MLLVLYKYLGGVTHEVLGHLQDVNRHGIRKESYPDLAGEVLEDLLDLLLEVAGENLVDLIENEVLKVVSLKEILLHHVVDTN